MNNSKGNDQTHKVPGGSEAELGVKSLQDVRAPLSRHWVGDGFPVKTLLAYHEDPELFSPYLLLDHAGPYRFEPSTRQPGRQRGVGEHPHRGFETVSLVYQGQVVHRDSSGAGGMIGPGDVQWMTAGAGVVHEELHSEEFSRLGGEFEVAQLWVNLPKAQKLVPPKYQSILSAQIPVVCEKVGAAQARVRVIAGRFRGQVGPAQSHSPLLLLDLDVEAGSDGGGTPICLEVPEGWNASLAVLKGEVEFRHPSAQKLESDQVGVLSRVGSKAEFWVTQDTHALLMAGAPLGEKVVGHGPFVMTSEEEIRQAFEDYRAGKMGHLPSH